MNLNLQVNVPPPQLLHQDEHGRHQSSGVRQGWILLAVLFVMALDFIMNKALIEPDAGINLDTNSQLTNLDFAGDIALLAEDWDCFQDPTLNLAWEVEKVRLCVSAEKSKIMHIGDQARLPKIGGQELKLVERFTYLGSVLSWDGDEETDLAWAGTFFFCLPVPFGSLATQ